MCHALKVTRSAFYQWQDKQRPGREPQRHREDQILGERIKDAFNEHHATYGIRRLQC